VGLAQHLGVGRVADDDRGLQPPGSGDERVVGAAFENHHLFALAQQFLDDAETDVSQAADDEVTALGDATDFERAAEVGPDQIVGEQGGEGGGERGADQTQSADERLLPGARVDVVAAHVGPGGEQADGPVEGVDKRVVLHAQMEHQHADEDDAKEQAGANLHRHLDRAEDAREHPQEPLRQAGPQQFGQRHVLPLGQ
jgi:hypothetical protein